MTEPVHRLLIIKLLFILLTLTGFCHIHARAKKNNTYILISVGKSSKTDKEVFHTKH